MAQLALPLSHARDEASEASGVDAQVLTFSEARRARECRRVQVPVGIAAKMEMKASKHIQHMDLI